MSIKIDPTTLIDPKFIGVPYRLGACSYQWADCIGICILWLRDQGLHYEYKDKFGPVMEHWWEHRPRRFIDAILQYGRILKFSEIARYDLILLFGDEAVNRFPTMLGVMVDDRHFLTSTEKRGSEVYMLSQHWKDKYFGALRLNQAVEKGLTDGN